MAEPLYIYPESDALLIRWLASQLTVLDPGVPVAAALPDDFGEAGGPTTVVVVQATGGYLPNLISEDAQVTFTTWSHTWDEAHRVARTVQALVMQLDDDGLLPSEVPVSQVAAFTTPYADPDPVTGGPRVSQTFGVRVRGRYA